MDQYSVDEANEQAILYIGHLYLQLLRFKISGGSELSTPTFKIEYPKIYGEILGYSILSEYIVLGYSILAHPVALYLYF